MSAPSSIYVGLLLTYPGRIVMIAMYREDWDRDIDIWVFVVDVVKDTAKTISNDQKGYPHVGYRPRKDLAAVTKHFQFARLLAKAIHAERPLDLEQCFP